MLNGRTIENFCEFKSIFYDKILEIYGTHDWIADRAICILYNQLPNDSLIGSIRHNKNHMRVYYLYGTELPDHMINPFKSIKITTDYGTKLSEDNFYKGHSVVMLPNGCISRKNKRLFNSTESIGKSFIENINSSKDYQVAALYLGFISHLIGDACYIHHVYEGPDESISQQTKGEILKRTRNTPEEILWPNSKSIRNYELAKNEFNRQWYTLENILFYCVWHTFFGKPHRYGAFQDIIIPDWKWYSTIKIQEIDKLKDSFLYRKWWEGIEVHLNMAIFYTAAAINSLRCLNKSS
ncbi:MAG: zinc dependent phospholipase C family protein [Candidatus Hodarchaeota archaeon]